MKACVGICCTTVKLNGMLFTKMIDHVLNYILNNKISLCQRNWLELNYGDKRNIKDLEGEELAELPDGFEDWPVDETAIN